MDAPVLIQGGEEQFHLPFPGLPLAAHQQVVDGMAVSYQQCGPLVDALQLLIEGVLAEQFGRLPLLLLQGNATRQQGLIEIVGIVEQLADAEHFVHVLVVLQKAVPLGAGKQGAQHAVGDLLGGEVCDTHICLLEKLLAPGQNVVLLPAHRRQGNPPIPDLGNGEVTLPLQLFGEELLFALKFLGCLPADGPILRKSVSFQHTLDLVKQHLAPLLSFLGPV